VISFSLDEGKSWDTCSFTTTQGKDLVDINGVVNEPDVNSHVLLVWGQNGEDYTGFVLAVDFKTLGLKECQGFQRPGQDGSDFEHWEPSDARGDRCLLGRRTQFIRRKRDVQCWIPANIGVDHIVLKNCSCSMADYECDFCFIKDSDHKCVPDVDGCPGYDAKAEPYPCFGTWPESKGYVRVPGDSCDPSTGVDLMPTWKTCTNKPWGPNGPTPKDNLTGDGASFTTGVLVAILIFALCSLIFGGLFIMSGRNEGVRNFMLHCLPERILPDLVVPNAQYGIMAAGDDDDDLRRGAAVLDLGNESDEDKVDLKSAGSPAASAL